MTPDGIDPLIGRLLGPSAPEIGCDECFDELDCYVEVQLLAGDADAAVPGMDAHLAGCPACNEEYESLLALLSEASPAGPSAAT